jgi:hypothetical protein
MQPFEIATGGLIRAAGQRDETTVCPENVTTSRGSPSPSRGAQRSDLRDEHEVVALGGSPPAAAR